MSEPGVPAATTSGIASAAGDVVVTRSEEQLAVRTVVAATERVLVRTVVVTEEVTKTITLRRQEIRVEHQRLPGFQDGSELPPGPTGATLTDDVQEFTLYAEVPVVGTRVVPVETVRLSKHVVTEERAVSADLDREQLHLDHAAHHDDKTRGGRDAAAGPDGLAPPPPP